MPYDWCITTKDFLLRSLAGGDGKEFTPPIDQLEVYEMTKDKTQGLGKDGVWLWHDFTRNGHSLTDSWASEVNYLSKYPVLWKRFLTLSRDPGKEKVFIVSNSQSNLDQFSSSDEDFFAKFGMNSEYLDALNEHLKAAGAKNYRLIVLLRGMGEYIDIISKSRLHNIDPRFVGALTLPFHQIVSEALLAPPASKSALERLVGKYDNGIHIIPAPFDSLVVLDSDGYACGVIKSVADRYVCSFTGGTDYVTYAIAEGESILFANKSSWRRIAS